MRRFLIVLVILASLSACDIFQLRESEEPLKDPLWNDFSTEASDVLKNIEYAYEDSRNAVRYASLFMGDYRFYFAAQDIIDYGIDSEWNQIDERDMLLNLHQSYSDVSVTLTELETADVLGSSEAKLFRSYELTGKSQPGVSSVIAKGNLEMHLRKTNFVWSIYKWYDYRSGADPTWGLLKHENL
jgi:hypothetical protein